MPSGRITGKNTASGTHKNLIHEIPAVVFVLALGPLGEEMRVKHVFSNDRLHKITGITEDEMFAPGFDFLKRVVLHEYHALIIATMEKLIPCLLCEQRTILFSIRDKYGEHRQLRGVFTPHERRYSQRYSQFVACCHSIPEDEDDKMNKGLREIKLLSCTERKLLGYIGDGLSMTEVAKKMEITVKTARTHRRNIQIKTNLHSMTLLVLLAIRAGLNSDSFQKK